MNSTPEHIPQGLVAAERGALSLRRTARRSLLAVTPLLLAGSLVAEDRKPVDAPRGERAANPDAPRGERAANPDAPRGERALNPGAPRGERAANPGAPRGERPAGPERSPGPERRRSEFPEELKLTDEQQAKIREITAEIGASDADMAKKRDAILTPEQRNAQNEVMQKIRDGGLSRQEAGELLASAVKFSPEQQKQIDELDGARRSLGQEANTRKMAVLTDEQRTTLRKLTTAAGIARIFSIPFEASDAQKASLKALQEELGPKLTELTEKQATLLTDERRAAREAAYKEARDAGKDRQETADAVNAALKMTDAEKAQLTETEQSLRELQGQIREKMMALLTPEQKAEFEKRFGTRR